MGHEADYPYIFKENMGIYLNALNECIRRRHPNAIVELVMVGGSSLILGNTFRLSTEDIDAFQLTNVGIKRCIKDVKDMFSITSDWLNDDFTKSPSYTPKIKKNKILVLHRSNLIVYRACDLDVFCMKLVSKRDKDFNDLFGMLRESLCRITRDKVFDRMQFLYGDEAYNKLGEVGIQFLLHNVPERI